MALQQRDLQIQGYERVIEAIDEERGLHTIIALHDTRRGPALGGTRIYPYHTRDEALTDVLRLAQGMTYKSAISGTPTGGGKSVILANPKTDKTQDLLEAFGEVVESLKGKYICAEDVGSSVEDMEVIHRTTSHVVGLPGFGKTGDPSRFTAYGVYMSILATAQRLWGTHDLSGKTIAIQGLGHVGTKLAEHLFWAGARLVLSDLDMLKAESIGKLYSATLIEPENILYHPCDILAPCAMGAILNEDSIPRLRCQAVVGAANNQLATPKDHKRLQDSSILYAPDFLVNAGGLITVCGELTPQGCNPVTARTQVASIYDTLLAIYDLSKKENISPDQAAHRIADQRLEAAISV